MKNHLTKRILALAIALCFVIGQSNLPDGLFHLSLDSVLDTKAAEKTFTVAKDNGIEYPVMYEITGANTVTVTGYNVDDTDRFQQTTTLTFANSAGVVPYGGTNYKVTAIADGAFSSFGYATKIVIPSTVTSIGKQAFLNMTNVESITFADGSSLTSIGDQAFQGCTNLNTALTIPASVTTVGDKAFYGCSKLKRVTFEGTSTALGDSVFESDSQLTSVQLPESATMIGARVFYNCSGLKAVNLPTGLTSIPDYTFYNCQNLYTDDIENYRQTEDDSNSKVTVRTGLTFPSGVTKIGDYAFYRCHAFAKLIMPESLQTIGDYTFYECTSLGATNDTFAFNNSLETIGDYAFANCSTLGGTTGSDGKIAFFTLTPPDSLKTIGNSAFRNCSNLCSFRFGKETQINKIDKYAFASTNLTSFSMPDTITELSNYLFSGSSLKMLSVSRDLTKIGDSTFENCSSFATLQTRTGDYSGTETEDASSTTADNDLSQSKITSIGTKAFMGTALVTFDLPKGVTEIYESTFSGCTQLTTFTFNGGTLTYIGKEAFLSCSLLGSIELPAGTADAPLSTVGTSAFSGCSKMVSFSFGTNTTITAIPDSMFNGNAALTSLALPKTVITIGGSAFSGCSALTTVTNAEQLTTINGSAFKNCSNFTGFNEAATLSLPSTLSSLGSGAFQGCTTLSEVSSLGSITAIPGSVFEGCAALANVTIDVGVTSIGAKAFKGAPIATLTFNTLSAPTLNSATDPCFTFTESTISSITCYEDVVTDLQEQFSKIGMTIPSSKFKTQQRPAGSVYQGSTTAFTLTIGNSKTLKKGTSGDFALLTNDGQLSSDSFSWSSSDSEVATVDAADSSSIIVKACDIGQAIITGTSKVGLVQFTVTVSPNGGNSVTNPYKSYQIYDITESGSTSDPTTGTCIYSYGDSTYAADSAYDKTLYFLNNTAEARTLCVVGTPTTAGNTIDDAFYWNLNNENATLEAAGDSVVTTIGDTTYIKGTTVVLTPSVSNSSTTLKLSTKKSYSSTVTYSTGDAISNLSYGNKAENGALQLAIGNSLDLNTVNYLVKNPSNPKETLTFTTDDTDYITITDKSKGSVKANALGTATVTATSNHTGTELVFKITVVNPISSATVADSTGNSISSISLFPDDITSVVLNWKYKDEFSVSEDYLDYSLDKDGIVEITDSQIDQKNATMTLTLKGLTAGTAKLSYAPNSGSTNGKGTIQITVQQPLQSLNIKEGQNAKTLALKETTALKGYLVATPTSHKDTIEWESNNTSVATVDSNGTVTAVGVGSCVIRAICRRTNIYAEYTITATNPATSATITPTALGSTDEPFYPGETKSVSLSTVAQDANTALADNAVSWVSANPEVATVSGGSNTGATIQALKTGSTTIRVMNEMNKQIATLSVQVSAPNIKLERTSVTLYKKIKKRKTYNINPTINGLSQTATYSSSKKKVATVSASGKITAKKKGSTVITITANGVSVKLNVTVSTAKPKVLSLTCGGSQVKKNKITVKKSLKSITTKANTNWTVYNTTYKSSKKKVATIDNKGVIKLKKKGTTKITITVDGIKRSYSLKVK